MKRGFNPKTGTFCRYFAGLVATFLAVAGLSDSALSETRTLPIYNIHTKEKAEITFKRDGEYLKDGLKQINHFFRDWRRDVETEIDPELVDLVWELHREFGSQKPVHLVSGFRSKKTNDSMRRRGGGQASKSRHILGKAADIHFPGVSVRQLRNSALVREVGGVGYYPKSGLPFVHVDTGRVRHWPRLGRQELAALFPHGRTQHVPRDGKPITRKDAERAIAALRKKGLPVPHEQRAIRLAKLENTDTQDREGLNRLIASSKPKAEPVAQTAPVVTASAKQQPQARPAVVTAGAGLTSLPWLARMNGMRGSLPAQDKPEAARPPVILASADPSQLLPGLPERNPAQLRPSITPEVMDRNNPLSPDFDPEHPEELAYEPFPVGTLMREASIAHDTVIAALEQPDHDEADYLLMQPERGITLQVKPYRGVRNMRLSWEFKSRTRLQPAPHETPSTAGGRVMTASNPAPVPTPASYGSGGYTGGGVSGGGGFGFSSGLQ